MAGIIVNNFETLEDQTIAHVKMLSIYNVIDMHQTVRQSLLGSIEHRRSKLKHLHGRTMQHGGTRPSSYSRSVAEHLRNSHPACHPSITTGELNNLFKSILPLQRYVKYYRVCKKRSILPRSRRYIVRGCDIYELWP
jgi:hypothetical protein